MRRSPRRPLILKRRKLPFHQNETPTAESQCRRAEGSKEPPKPGASQCFPDGIRIMDHPTMSDTQVVVIPKTADLQSVIGALTAKEQCGVQGRNKFILLSGCGGEDDESLTSIQWLGKTSTTGPEPNPAKPPVNKENQVQEHKPLTSTGAVHQPHLERPPYSYMAMIQFAINSKHNRKMTLKEIYMWVEDHFPYYREVAKPGWKNSIRHNLSLHDMFIRETTPDGKISFWTIRPDANRHLTLDQVYKPGCAMTTTVPVPLFVFPHQKVLSFLCSERKMKPLLPRTDSYLVPIQLPVTQSVYLPSSSTPVPPTYSQQKQTTARRAKRVRIAPKVTETDSSAMLTSPHQNKEIKVEVKEEPVCIPIKCETPKAAPKRQASSSRRKQRLVHSMQDEPMLLCPDSTFFDSAVVSDTSTFQDVRDTVLDDHQYGQGSPNREFSFKTPIKNSSHLISSTPSKPSCNVTLEPWKVTPVGKGNQSVLDFSPIRTPGGPAVTPHHEYTTFSFSGTPFKDLPLFNSPRELLTSASFRETRLAGSPTEHLKSSCSKELLKVGGVMPASRSFTEGLVLDTMNDSLSKIFVDFSFTGLDDEDLGMANISWSEFIPQLK
ncbi:LOW QUALITY PROTEIN: forkhead box protein M1 [Pholidichthys leucotaenia]